MIVNAAARLYRRTILISAVALTLAVPSASAEPGLVAAASDLNRALPALIERFAAERGGVRAPRLSFGSSGNLTRQIEQGAPFELFFSADEEYVRRLHQRGLTEDAGVRYGRGLLVLYAPAASPLRLDAALAGLATALSGDALNRFAIANPEHAPYGRAARAALQNARLWERIEPRLVFGENAAQAAQFAFSGAADGGLVAHALAVSAEPRRGRFVLIDPALYPPLWQRMVLLKNAGSEVRALYQFVQTPAAAEVLREFGFELP